MANPRSFHNLTALPDGTVLATGGETHSDGADPAFAVHAAELWSPDTEKWTSMASAATGRMYHSTALLLPDARVLVAGSGGTGNEPIEDNAEIYSPPYLFKGARPTISSAPSSAIAYGSSFTVTTPDAAQIGSVSLVRLGSVTHAFDQEQRYVPLSFTAGSGQLTVQAPPSGNIAPPGYYMLFIVNSNGVPSVSKFIRFPAPWEDTQPPTAPTNLTATGAIGTVTLNWTAASDNTGVAKYSVYRSTTSGFTPDVTNRIGQTAATNYTDTVAAGTYFYKVKAEDLVGNLSPASNEASAVVGDTSPPTAPGTLTATGAVGKATLSWGAASDNVGVVRYDLYRSSTSGFTPSVANRIAQPSGLSYTDSGLAAGTYYYKVQAEDAAGNIGPATNEASALVLADTSAPSVPANLAASVAGGTVNLSWSASSDDVAVTRYDLYRGTSPGFTPSLANRIAQPAGTSYGDSGLAIGSYYYKVAAEDAAGNISGPSNEVAATVADSTPPTAPSNLGATIVGTTVNLAWSASSDNVGVLRYNLYRGTSAGFTPSVANRIAQPTTTLYSDIGLPAGSYYYKLTAEDGAGNVSGLSNEVAATIPDTTPPTVPANLTATGGAGQASLSWSAATDNIAVSRYDLYRSSTSGFTPSVANRIAQPTGLSYSDLGLAAGTYYYKVQAEDGAGNLSGASNETSAVVASAAPTGLVAAYGFDAGSGTTAADSSGNGNSGTLTNTTWSTAGKYGGALSFNGSSSWVTAADNASLDLTNGMTLEGWVNPSASGTVWRTVLIKQNTNALVYSLYANTDTQRPSGHVFTSAEFDTRGTAALPLNAWSFLAASYDGATLRLYVNGTQVSSKAVSGSMPNSTGVLRIGGNSIWGEYFAGLIDNVRIYNRALSASEILTDMNTRVN
jgi:hypothetical protein